MDACKSGSAMVGLATRGFVKIYDPTPPALTGQAAMPWQPSRVPPGLAGSQLAAGVPAARGTSEAASQCNRSRNRSPRTGLSPRWLSPWKG